MLQWSKDSAAFWVGSGNLRPVKLGNGSIRKAFVLPKWSKLDLHDSGLNEIEESYLMSICSTFPPKSFIPHPFHNIMASNNQRSPVAKPRPGWISKIWQPKYAQISTNLGWMRDSAPVDEPFRWTRVKRKLTWKNLHVQYMTSWLVTALQLWFVNIFRLVVWTHIVILKGRPSSGFFSCPAWFPANIFITFKKTTKDIFPKYVQDPNLESCHAPAGTC